MVRKRLAAIVLTAAFVSLAAVPDTFADNRFRGRRFDRGRSYYNNGARCDNGRRSSVLGQRYYNNRFNNRRVDRRFDRDNYRGYRGRRDRGGLGSTGRAVLTVGAPAAVGAGVGALLGGGKGAAVGALLGGGGGAIYYLSKNRNRNRYRR